MRNKLKIIYGYKFDTVSKKQDMSYPEKFTRALKITPLPTIKEVFGDDE